MTAPRAHRNLWDALVGAAAALLVFGAVPGVLVGLVGLPVPRHWTGHDVVSWHGLFDLLAVLSWCAWAACAWPVLRAVAVRVQSGDVASAPRLTDRVAVRIVLGLLAWSSLIGLGASAAASSTAGASVVVPAPWASPSPIAPSRAAVPPAPDRTARIGGVGSVGRAEPTVDAAIRRKPATERTTRHVVGRGDTLASLAAAHYGDASSWPAIATVNLGRLMADETRFVDPSVIVPGWSLELPTLDAGGLTGGGTAPPGGHGPVSPGPPADELIAADPLSSAGAGLPLAELAAAGVSALVAGLLARRARQLRRLRAFLRDEGEESPDPREREADLGALLAPFERLPLVDMVELAARKLGDAIATADPPHGAVQWLRAGRDGVEVRFSEPVPVDVPGWRRTGSSTWLLPATVDIEELPRTLDRGEPWCAVLLPLGDDDRGTWLLPVAAGTCVAVVGPRAEDLVRAMRAAVGTWSWHEELVVTDRPGEAAVAAGHATGRSAGARLSGSTVLFVGDPQTLPATAKHACAVLTVRQVDDADVTVVVDSRAASAHPLGLTVRPPLLDRSWKGAVDAIASLRADGGAAATDGRGATEATDERRDGRDGDDAARRGDTDARGTPRPLVQRRSAPATLRVVERDAADAAPPDLFSWAGAQVAGPDHRPKTPPSPGREGPQVRLLASVPGIVGLQGELPAKRARRAVELIAYLAMHAPDPVTGDRLRTRVLGSADADAAAKTLFNTVGAARRALGAAPDGEPLLPPASRSGHYHLSPLVTVDALRACAVLREGLASRDPSASVASLREGLELVKGEPLGGVLTGYSWWRAEGHERRVADTVVDGACALVRAALASGQLDLARWALAKARTVEPYSESLTRAAMRVAAAAGDARRLYAEWQECRRQMDELDPGGTPSERTEQLYALLRAQLAGDGAQVALQASFAAIDAAPFKTVPSAPSTV